MTAPVRAASLLLFLAIIALGGGLLALHFDPEAQGVRGGICGPALRVGTAPYRTSPRDSVHARRPTGLR